MSVLFTTAVGETPDYFNISVTDNRLRYSLPAPPFGLRFLRHNVPGIGLLEYPSFEEFEKRLEGVDTLGISFYMADVPLVLEMVETARKKGIREIWGGNYGILTPGIKEIFDRTFTGYSEAEISRMINGNVVGEIKHPEIITTFGIKNSPFRISHAFLFTTRGCRMKCRFCQTPNFTRCLETLPIGSVEDVIKRYKERRVKSVFIMDDNFFGDRRYSEKVLQLLEESDLNWGVCTRAENLSGRVREFREMGMINCIIGIESLRQENLDSMEKKTDVDLLTNTIDELDRNRIYTHGTCMIGFENDTKKSVREDIDAFSKLRVQSMQIGVLTPFPETPLWGHIEKEYGIIKDDYSKFDAYHLVWNHPNIKPEEMENILKYARMKCYPPSKVIRGFMQVIRRGMFWKFFNPL